ncbi:MAG: penicillin-binding protein 1C [Verrucomicrobiales bacterium]|nr:penicillin-binding protein 1C [Verrucomicrobiales bacterium]
MGKSKKQNSKLDQPLKRKRRLRRFVVGLGGLALFGYLVLLYIVPWFFEMPTGLQEGPLTGLEFTDRDGKPLRRLLADDLRIDRPATIDEIPKRLIDATLAAEDSRFFSHNGIDYIGTIRAVRDAILHRKFVSGASTVTQQLVKITSPPRERELKTKAIEAFTARRIEMSWSKDEILAAYMNRLPYGNQLHGCRAAARGYFGKPLADLSIAESAFLAGLPNKPTRLNPYRNFQGARGRQVWILNRLLTEGWITEEEFLVALDEKIVLQPRSSQVFHAPHFLELILEQKVPQTASFDFPDHTVQTTLDLDLQKFVEATIHEQLSQLGDDEDGASDAFQGAVVVIENATGDVLALAGSRDFFNSPGGQINGAWRPRSAGSTLKPFTYLLALEYGFTAASVIPDLPVEYITATGSYRPVNYNRRFHGPVSLRYALANSLNVPAVRTLDEIGGAEKLHTILTRDLGLTGLSPEASHYGLGLTIGNAEVRLLELANAYAALARLGQFRPVNLIKTKQQGSFGEPTLLDRSACWLIADILSDNAARADSFGFDSPLRLPFRAACKTGTSTDYRDNWTLGFTPEFTVGVWVGRFDNAPLQNVSGISGAGPIFQEVMTRVHRDTPATWYEKPDSIVEVEIDRLNGKRVHDGLKILPRKTAIEFFRRDFLPVRALPENYSADGRTLLPPNYANWFSGGSNSVRQFAAIDSGERPAETETKFRIVSPLSGTIAYLDPDLPNGGRFFLLKTEGESGGIQWRSPTLKIQSRENRDPVVVLQPGAHEILAIDAEGREVRSRLVVEEL